MGSPDTLSEVDDTDEDILGPGAQGSGDDEENVDTDEDESMAESDDTFSTAPWLHGLSVVDALGEEFDKVVSQLGIHIYPDFLHQALIDSHVDPISRLSADDLQDIRAFNLKTDTNLGSRNFAKLRRSKLVHNIETLHRIQARVSFLSGIKVKTSELHMLCKLVHLLYVDT